MPFCSAVRRRESKPPLSVTPAAGPGVSFSSVMRQPPSSPEKRAQEIGVDGFWYKEYSETSLLELMDEVMAGKTVFPGQTPQLNLGNASREQFTERELDVLRELTQGKSNEEIAQALGISVNGVKFHIKNLLEKTGFSNRLMLVVHANACGIVSGRSVVRKEN